MRAHRCRDPGLAEALVQPASSSRTENRGSQIECHRVAIQRGHSLPADRQLTQSHIGTQSPSTDVAAFRLGWGWVNGARGRRPVSISGASQIQSRLRIHVTHNPDNGSLRHVTGLVVPEHVLPGELREILLTPNTPASHSVLVVHGFMQGFRGQRGRGVELSAGFLNDYVEFPRATHRDQ